MLTFAWLSHPRTVLGRNEMILTLVNYSYNKSANGDQDRVARVALDNCSIGCNNLEKVMSKSERVIPPRPFSPQLNWFHRITAATAVTAAAAAATTSATTRRHMSCNWVRNHWIDCTTINLFIAGIGASCCLGDDPSIHPSTQWSDWSIVKSYLTSWSAAIRPECFPAMKWSQIR